LPCYHFIVHDGTNLDDPDGTDLPDPQTARIEAVRLAGALLADAPREFWRSRDWHIEVRDAGGLYLFRIDVRASDASAA
jgi:hypothetical protein